MILNYHITILYYMKHAQCENAINRAKKKIQKKMMPPDSVFNIILTLAYF